jgi:peptidoglycan/LPS O-acetylase OafA/YrhL
MFGLKLRGIPELDSLRFFAASSVVLHHLYFKSNAFFSWFEKYGNIGVDVFFVLSGFIITFGILEKKAAFNYKKFLIRRVLRLWPTLYTTLFLSTIVLFYFAKKDATLAQDLKYKLWHYYFHFANYSYAYTGKVHHIIGHFWSLAIEEHFYLLWGAAIFLLQKNKKYLYYTLAILILLPLLNRYFLYVTPTNPYIIAFATHNRLDSLAIGCLLALFYPKVKIKGPLADSITLLLMLLVFVLGLKISTSSSLSPILKTFDYTLISLGSALLILSAMNQSGLLNKILRVPFLATLGLLSYGVYMFHLLTHTIVFSIVTHFAPSTSHGTIAVIAFIAPYVPAYLFYKYIDRYFMSLYSPQ